MVDGEASYGLQSEDESTPESEDDGRFSSVVEQRFRNSEAGPVADITADLPDAPKDDPPEEGGDEPPASEPPGGLTWAECFAAKSAEARALRRQLEESNARREALRAELSTVAFRVGSLQRAARAIFPGDILVTESDGGRRVRVIEVDGREVAAEILEAGTFPASSLVGARSDLHAFHLWFHEDGSPVIPPCACRKKSIAPVRPSFKKGDRVRVISSVWPSIVGRLATVLHALPSGEVLRIEVDGESATYSLASGCVELANPSPAPSSSYERPPVPRGHGSGTCGVPHCGRWFPRIIGANLVCKHDDTFEAFSVANPSPLPIGAAPAFVACASADEANAATALLGAAHEYASREPGAGPDESYRLAYAVLERARVFGAAAGLRSGSTDAAPETPRPFEGWGCPCGAANELDCVECWKCTRARRADATPLGKAIPQGSPPVDAAAAWGAFASPVFVPDPDVLPFGERATSRGIEEDEEDEDEDEDDGPIEVPALATTADAARISVIGSALALVRNMRAGRRFGEDLDGLVSAVAALERAVST